MWQKKTKKKCRAYYIIMVFVTGFSGRFPACRSLQEFVDKLYGAVDLVTSHGRYPPGFHQLPERAGTLVDVDRFDYTLFGITRYHADFLDPQIRLTLESVYEALMDAGLEVETLRGQNIGVYVGTCGQDFSTAILRRIDDVAGYENVGTAKTMFSNRVSFHFNFRGPSLTVDTACSSSLTALSLAFQEVASGRIDRAVVVGTTLLLDPAVWKSFQKYGMLSPDGRCKTFDVKADGYVRSEGVVTVILEGDRVAGPRRYARLLAVGVNNDGYKTQGITFPSATAQADLFRDVLARSGISASDVEYVEAHGTGTVAGDRVELQSLDEVYGTERSDPLLVGSVKSNVGHSEGASGLMALIKVLLMYETGKIPPNLHFEETHHRPILEHRFKVVDTVTEWRRGPVAINNYGFGGSNAHVLMARATTPTTTTTTTTTPTPQAKCGKIFLFGRSENEIRSSTLETRAWRRWNPNARNLRHFPCRAIATVTDARAVPTLQKVNTVRDSTPLVVFSFTGQGSQWDRMARDLYMDPDDDLFRTTVIEASRLLPPEVDVDSLFREGDRWCDKRFSSLGITLVQIGLVTLLRERYGVVPDLVVGHSVGEIACAFVDLDHSAETLALLSYERNRIVIENLERVAGAMASIGVGYEQGLRLCDQYPGRLTVACDNGTQNVTISGDSDVVDEVVATLGSGGIFARRVPTDGVAYHSVAMGTLRDTILEQFRRILGDGERPRSRRWISTTDTTLPTCGAEYYTRNMCDRVRYTEALRSLPANSVVIEIGPHALLKNVITKTREDLTVIPSLVRGSTSKKDLDELVQGLWLAGLTPTIPSGCWGDSVDTGTSVARFNWVHDESLRMPTVEDFVSEHTKRICYDLVKEHAHLLDHVIQRQPLFPAVGYVHALWTVVGMEHDVEIEDLRILRPTPLTGDKIELSVHCCGDRYSLHENDEEVCTARCRITNTNTNTKTGHRSLPLGSLDDVEVERVMSGEEHYSLLGRCGYQHRGEFAGIVRRTWCGTWNEVQASRWIPYLDSVVQCSLLPSDTQLRLPVYIRRIRLTATDERQLRSSLHVIWNRSLELGRSHLVATLVEIDGLEVAPLTPQPQRGLRESAVQFVAYGEHRFKSGQDYKRRLQDWMRGRFLSLYRGLAPETLARHPHLTNVFAVATALRAGPDQGQGQEPDPELVTDADHLMARIMDRMYQDPRLLEDPLGIIVKDPDHGDYYFRDPTCLIPRSQLETVTQIIRENVGRRFRVLEVGTGTGGLTRQLYPVIRNDIEEYMATDLTPIRPPFPGIMTGVYDVNSPWGGEKMDVVVACNSVHTCRDILHTLQHLADGLQDGGFLLLSENVHDGPLYLWGLSDIIWKTATDRRDYGMGNKKDTWLSLFETSGLFKPVIWFVDEAPETTLLILCQKVSTTCPASVGDWETLQKCLREGTPRVRCESHDQGFIGLVRCLRKETSSLVTYHDDGDAGGDLLINVRDPHGTRGCYVQTELPAPAPAPAPTDDGVYHLEMMKHGDLGSFRWVRDSNEKTVRVHYSSLNFRDVMISFGALNLPVTGIGLEFSGTVCADGTRVMGFATPSIATYLPTLRPRSYWEVPPHLSLAEGGTIPVAYGTVYYSLVHRAGIVAGQTVLIHSVTGGVGLSAYHICRFRGVHMIVTCSQQKRQYVSDTLGIPDDRILDSHSTSFRDEVLRLTGGKGVDVVLNSLAGDKLVAGIECVKKFGHFCEIGKYDIQQNTQLGLKLLQKYISFHTIDLDEVLRDDGDEWRRVYELVAEGLRSGEIVPLRHQEYTEIEPALRYMSTGKHIGKILLKMGSDALTQYPVVHRYRTRGTHLVVGGLGGVGVELTEWLFQHGAERVVVTTRGPGYKNDYQRWKLSKYNVVVESADVVDERTCDELLRKYGTDVTGVWNLALVLNDTLLEGMTRERWHTTVACKATVCRNLDNGTRTHCPHLTDFVMFSSVTALLGNAGQCNYAYGNSVMEQVCRDRHAEGLPALAVAWGPIADVGVVALGDASLQESLRSYEPQRIASCLTTLEKMMTSGVPVVASYVVAETSTVTTTGVVSLEQRLRQILGMRETQIPEGNTLTTLGVDSLQAVEIRSVLQQKGINKTLAEVTQLKWGDILALQ